MTNQEKAQDLAQLYRKRLEADTTLCNDDLNAASVEMYERCLKMADWKDNQLKEEFNVPDYYKTTEEIFNFIGNDVYAKGYNKAKDYDKRFILRKRDSLLRKIDDDNNFYTSAEYYPEEDVTVYCRNIFEGYHFDDFIQVFYGLCKGRGDVEELFEDIEDDED